MRSIRVAVLPLFAAGVLITAQACDMRGGLSPALPDAGDISATAASAQHARGQVLPLEEFGRAKHGKCHAPPARGFDFWIGNWDVTGTADGAFAGTNTIASAVGGCAIEERWTGNDGVRGRSVSAFDAASGTWGQLWMDQTGGALILDGSARHRGMQLSGTHPTSRNDPTPLTDRVTWSSLRGNQVRQIGELSVDGAPFGPVYDLTYDKVQTPRAIELSPLEFCSSPARPRFHAFDFLVGSWTARRDGASATLQTVVGTDLGSCLVEHRMRGPGGYEAIAYSGFRSATFEWNWMFVDSRGVRLLLHGPATLTGTNMILEGTSVDRDGSPTAIRVEWAQVDESTVEQRWSFSIDSGTTWSTPVVVTMQRN